MWFYRPPGATNYHLDVGEDPSHIWALWAEGVAKTSPFPPRSARLPYGSRPSAWVSVSPFTKFCTCVQNRSNGRNPRIDWRRSMERPERRKTDSAGSANIHTCATRNEDLARGARVWSSLWQGYWLAWSPKRFGRPGSLPLSARYHDVHVGTPLMSKVAVETKRPP